MMRAVGHLGRITLWTALIIQFLGPSAAPAQPGAVMTLQESIDLAMKQSVLIHSAREGIKGAEAQQREAFTAFLPKFGTSYSYTHLNEAPGLTLPAMPPLLPSSTAIQSGTRDNYNWALEVRQPLFAGGAIAAGYRASLLGTDIARIDESLTIQNAVLEAKTAYLDVLKAEKLLTVAHQTLEQLQAHRNVAQNFFDVGMIPRNDLLQAEVQLANGVQYALKAENGLALARAKFNTTLRREIDMPVNLEDLLEYSPFMKGFEECLRKAFDRRGELRQHHLKLEQAKQMVRVAKSEYLPSVNLAGHYARFGDQPNVSGSAFNDAESWQVIAVANWNFWEWGKTKNRVEVNRSRENQAADALTKVRDQIMLEVKNAWLQVREAEKQILVARKTIEQADENFRINEERYRAQVATSTDVLDALTLLTQAKADHTQALGDYHIYQARLDRAMGLN